MKATKLISIDENVLDHIEQNPDMDNFSGWVQECYVNEFMNDEKIRENIIKTRRKLRFLEKKLTTDVKKATFLYKAMTTDVVNFFKNGVKARLDRGGTIDKILLFFNNEFNETLTMQQFRKRYDDLNENKTKNTN